MTGLETFSRVVSDQRRGMAIKEIARKRKLSRTTVKKILAAKEAGKDALSYERTQQCYPQLESYRIRLEEELEKDRQVHRRHRRRLTGIFEMLQREGYNGGYDSVRRYARKWQSAHGMESIPPACVPLVFKPGEAYQFDWSEEHVVLKGAVTKVRVAQLTLCYSRMSYQRVYLREKQEMVFDAHAKGFEALGGSCERGIYDNMKTVVLYVKVGKERVWQRRFLQMVAHYGVEAEACTPSSPQEKGRVERRIQTMQNDFFRPAPKVETLEELNAALERDSQERAMRRPHPDSPNRTVWEVYLEERPLLMRFPGPFDGYAPHVGKVNPDLLVYHDNNLYSVEASARGRNVDVRAYADRVVLLRDGKVVGEHERSFKRDETIFNVRHYIPLLERKPGAVRNGKPFQEDVLPKGLARARAWLERYKDGMRQLVKILLQVPRYGLEHVEEACCTVLDAGSLSADLVLNHLARQHAPAPPQDLVPPQQLRLREEPSTDCSVFDNLLTRKDHPQ